MHNGDQSSHKKNPGHKRITSSAMTIFLTMAFRKEFSLQKNLSKFGESKNTIYRRILESKRIVYKKILKKTFCKKEYKSMRLNWANKIVSYGDKWLSTLFSRKKKRNF